MIENLLEKQPSSIEDDIYIFGNIEDGDCFDDPDVEIWKSGCFEKNWNNNYFLENEVSRDLLNKIIREGQFVVDLASGPGMGLIPSLKKIDSSFPCVASDANLMVMKEWKRYLESKSQINELEFTQFSVFDIPFKDNSVPAYSSFIGLSNTRKGNIGYKKALAEIHRTLADNGMFFTIESEWNDIPNILKLFEKMNQQPWNCFTEKQTSWHDRFIESGFEIIFEKKFDYRSLNKDDNELGEAADKFGFEIGILFTAHGVKKRRTE